MRQKFLKAILFLAAIPNYRVIAQEILSVDDVFYKVIDANKVEIAGVPDIKKIPSSLTIPSAISSDGVDYQVVNVGTNAFSSCKNLNYIILPESIDSIKEGAFMESGLMKINIPQNTKFIGYNAFNSVSITDLELPNSISVIEGMAFYGCNNLQKVKLSQGIKQITNGCFAQCLNLQSIVIPSQVEEIVVWAIESNVLNYVYFEPNMNLKKIGSNNFKNAWNLDYMFFPVGSDKVNIEYPSFNKSNIGTLVLPKSISNISFNCNSLKEIYCRGDVPEYTFFDSNGTQFESNPPKVYVNNKYLVNYQLDKSWKQFDLEGLDEEVLNSRIDEIEQTIRKMISGYSTTHNLTITSSGGGQIVYNDEIISDTSIQKEANDGDNISISIQPFEGYYLAKLTLNENNVTEQVTDGIFSYTVNEEEGDIIIEAYFVEKPLILTIQHADNGSIKQYVEKGRSVRFIIEPSDGWKINTILYNGSDVTSELNNENEFITPAINSNATLSVSFESTQSGIASVRNSKTKVYGDNGQIVISGADFGERISVYNESGIALSKITSDGKVQRINIGTKGIFLVKCEGKTFKVSL